MPFHFKGKIHTSMCSVPYSIIKFIFLCTIHHMNGISIKSTNELNLYFQRFSGISRILVEHESAKIMGSKSGLAPFSTQVYISGRIIALLYAHMKENLMEFSLMKRKRFILTIAKRITFLIIIMFIFKRWLKN